MARAAQQPDEAIVAQIANSKTKIVVLDITYNHILLNISDMNSNLTEHVAMQEENSDEDTMS